MEVERQTRAGEIEAVIRHLRGIISSRVVLAPTGAIEEIHVLTEGSRVPKQIVRDIESALMAELGVEVDHKKVSVAQVQDRGQKFQQARLKFQQVSLSLNGSNAQAEVRLTNDDDVYTGVGEGQSSSHGQMRLIANATLRAVEDSGAHEGAMVIEDIQMFNMSGRNVVVNLISMTTDRGEDYLAGVAVVKQDLWKAVVNATLDAVNRRLSVIKDR